MIGKQVCERCGRELRPGDAQCPECAQPPWWRRDLIVFLALLGMAVLMFMIAYTVTSAYRRSEDAIARASFQRGKDALSAGKPERAVGEFRTAVFYARDNSLYRLRLAQALARSDVPNQSNQAIAYLLNLWEQEPGNGIYNLELARLAARQHRSNDAIRYFHSAIFGVWDDDPMGWRRAARVELIRYLMTERQIPQAQSEVLALAADTSENDSAALLQVADLMRDTSEYPRALSLYSQVLGKEPKNTAAKLGAGKAAFALGQYTAAKRYLDAVLQDDPNQPAARQLDDQATMVLASNPFARGVSATERAKRVVSAYQQAGVRLQSCANAKGITLISLPEQGNLPVLYSQWLAARASADIRQLAHDSDQRESLMELVGRIESASAQVCGPPSGIDWALTAVMLQREAE